MPFRLCKIRKIPATFSLCGISLLVWRDQHCRFHVPPKDTWVVTLQVSHSSAGATAGGVSHQSDGVSGGKPLLLWLHSALDHPGDPLRRQLPSEHAKVHLKHLNANPIKARSANHNLKPCELGMFFCFFARGRWLHLLHPPPPLSFGSSPLLSAAFIKRLSSSLSDTVGTGCFLGSAPS